MMTEKRKRDLLNERTNEPQDREYPVCDQCRVKKIRCGREKPSCHNCRRGGQDCEWTGQGKKPNQTALLSHTVLGLSSRLEHLEKSMSDIQNSIQRLGLQASAFALTPSTSHPGGASFVTTGSAHPFSLLLSGFQMPRGRFIANDKSDSDVRYFGPTSLTTIMHDMSDLIIKLPCNAGSESGPVRECALLARRKIEMLGQDREDEPIKEDAMPTAPPSYLLDAMFEHYFATINPLFPIWTKNRFTRLAATSRRSENFALNLAFHICSNNLILMSLTTKSIRPPSREKAQSEDTRKNSSIDSDLIQTFLTNAKRAIKNVELLLPPCLINVQALLSLCVIAQEHLSSELFVMLFNLAAQCAKSVGLHQWHYSRGQISDEDTEERRNVSYCLYILDKAVCWTTGTSPSIPRLDISIFSDFDSPDDEAARHLVIKVKLAEIEEDSFSQIYSGQASVKNEDQIRESIFEIYHRLQGWSAESKVDAEGVANNVNDFSALEIELSFAFSSIQLLLLWPFQESSDTSFQRTEVAKRCIRLLLRLWRSASEPRHLVALARLIASHPGFYLHQICTHIINGQGDESDVDMLKFYIDMLQSITASRGRGTSNKIMYEFSVILMEVVVAIKAQESPQRSQSRPKERQLWQLPGNLTPFHSPTTDAFASNTTANHSSSSMLEDYQSLTGLTFPHLGDSLAHIGSASSGNAEFEAGFSAGVLSTITGAYDGGPFENVDNVSDSYI